MSYLSPEPLLEVPEYAQWMAKKGLTTPTYAYAGNNPIAFIDPDGLHRRGKYPLRPPAPPHRRPVPPPTPPSLPPKAPLEPSECKPGREDTACEKECERDQEVDIEDCYDRHPFEIGRDENGHVVRIMDKVGVRTCLRAASERYAACLKACATGGP